MSNTAFKISEDFRSSSSVTLPEKVGKLNRISIVAAKNQSNRAWFRLSLGIAAISIFILGLCVAALIGTYTHLPVAQWVKIFANKVDSYLPLMTSLSGDICLFSLLIVGVKRHLLTDGEAELEMLVKEAKTIAENRIANLPPFNPDEMKQFSNYPNKSLIWGKHNNLKNEESFFVFLKDEKGIVYLNKLSEEEKNLIVDLRVLEGWLDTKHYGLLFL
jgi:hypothetical protein